MKKLKHWNLKRLFIIINKLFLLIFNPYNYMSFYKMNYFRAYDRAPKQVDFELPNELISSSQTISFWAPKWDSFKVIKI